MRGNCRHLCHNVAGDEIRESGFRRPFCFSGIFYFGGSCMATKVRGGNLLRRMVMLALALVLAFSFLAFRVLSLQVFHFERYQKKVFDQLTTPIAMPGHLRSWKSSRNYMKVQLLRPAAMAL